MRKDQFWQKLASAGIGFSLFLAIFTLPTSAAERYTATVPLAVAKGNDHQKAAVCDSSASRLQFLEYAQSQIGYWSGNVAGDSIVFPCTNADGWTKYGAQQFSSGTGSWCAAFISWCADQASIPDSKLRRGSYAYINMFQTPDPSSADAAKRNDNGGQYFARGEKTPQPGDLIYYIWMGSGHRYASHIAIVEKVDADYVYTIEGNAGKTIDGVRIKGVVQRKVWRLDEKQIKGYFRVNW
ncbi:MAG: CHAP domain-containing protein [Oscillospiraceae bacterium]|jgi:hypothetical protein|nr:CHAP domain-containing protein [Oscillospiraceae bacterium]